MQNFDTYNRVDSLREKRPSLTVMIICFILLSSALAGSLLISQNYWLTVVILVAAATLTLFWLNFRKKLLICKRCGTPLKAITRPMILTAKFLAMKGVKEGDYFFTLDKEGNTPFKNQWVKISHQVYTCPTCRILEKNHHTVIEPVSEDEIPALKQ